MSKEDIQRKLIYGLQEKKNLNNISSQITNSPADHSLVLKIDLLKEKLHEKDSKIMDLSKIIDSLYDLNCKLNLELFGKKVNPETLPYNRENKERTLENEIKEILYTLKREVIIRIIKKERLEKENTQMKEENIKLKKKLSELIKLVENDNIGKYYYEYNDLKKRADQLEVFFYNFSIFSKKILNKELIEFDSKVFLELEQFINSLKGDDPLKSKSLIPITEHHRIINNLNFKVNKLSENNKNLRYKSSKIKERT